MLFHSSFLTCSCENLKTKSSLRLIRRLRYAACSEPRARERPPRATPQACLRIKWNPRKRQAQARKVDSLPVILFRKRALASSPMPAADQSEELPRAARFRRSYERRTVFHHPRPCPNIRTSPCSCHPLRTIDGSGRVEPFPREPVINWPLPALMCRCQRLPSTECPQIRQPVRNESVFWLDLKPDFRPSFPYRILLRAVCSIKIPRNVDSERSKI